jgi:hypothetical protein
LAQPSLWLYYITADELQTLLLKGLKGKGAATKGTKLDFDCDSNGISVAVDGKSQGKVSSSTIADAFCQVYLDDNCVSPSLRNNILTNCCAAQ